MIKFDSEKGFIMAEGHITTILTEMHFFISNILYKMSKGDKGMFQEYTAEFALVLVQAAGDDELFEALSKACNSGTDLTGKISLDIDAVKEMMKGMGNDETT